MVGPTIRDATYAERLCRSRLARLAAARQRARNGAMIAARQAGDVLVSSGRPRHVARALTTSAGPAIRTP